MPILDSYPYVMGCGAVSAAAVRALHAALGTGRVALLEGGGIFHRPPTATGAGGPIQACDGECVAATEAVLQVAGFDVLKLSADLLGDASAAGGAARAALETCGCAVLPGGHEVPQVESLGVLGRAALEAVLERGGGLVGICAGAWVLGEGAPIYGQRNPHCWGWLPVACDAAFGANSCGGGRVNLLHPLLTAPSVSGRRESVSRLTVPPTR